MFSVSLKVPGSANYQRKARAYVRSGVCHAGKGFGKKKVVVESSEGEEDNVKDDASRETLSTSMSVRDENVRATTAQTASTGSTSTTTSMSSGASGNRRSRRRRAPTGM